MTKKRGYSKEFTPRTERRLTLMADRVPATLHKDVLTKVKDQQPPTSVRAVILGLLRKWVRGEVSHE